MRHSTEAAKKHFKKPIDAVEVGVYQGDNALSILQNLNIRKMHLVDPYKVFVEPSSRMGRTEDFPENEKIAREKLKGYADKCHWHICRSDEVDLPAVDFVYVDGSHEYENVIKDLYYCWSIIRPGGILAGHDWHSKGVNKAVQEFSEKTGKKVYRADGKSDWWIFK
jgi:hypothetical protein